MNKIELLVAGVLFAANFKRTECMDCFYRYHRDTRYSVDSATVEQIRQLIEGLRTIGIDYKLVEEKIRTQKLCEEPELFRIDPEKEGLNSCMSTDAFIKAVVEMLNQPVSNQSAL